MEMNEIAFLINRDDDMCSAFINEVSDEVFVSARTLLAVSLVYHEPFGKLRTGLTNESSLKFFNA
jgi:hypothetical protein